MKARVSLILTKVRLSIRTIAWLLSKWRNALMAAAIALLFFELVYWMFNLFVLATILTSANVLFVEKISVLLSPFESIATSNGVGFLVVLVSLAVVQGISITTLIFVTRHQHRLDDKLASGSSLVALLAVVGLGCPACGTSLITPIVALFVSGSSVAISEQITVVAAPVALFVGSYGLYVVGLRVANIKVMEEL